MAHKLSPIKHEHIVEAAGIIDQEEMPKSYVGDYMVEVNGKYYHFKHLMRTAYKLATGTEVKPGFFRSNKSIRQKIIDLDFTIINRKTTETMMKPLKIYKIAASASPNSEILFSPDKASFYWNQKMFRKNKVGDYVMFVNKHKGFALLTEINAKDIPATYDDATKKSSFSRGNVHYSVEKKFNDFVEFKIIRQENIPAGWRWTREIGASETYDLYYPGIGKIPDKIDKLNDLLKIFTSGKANEIINEYKNFMSENNPTLDLADILERPDIQDLINSPIFYFENAHSAKENFLLYKPIRTRESIEQTARKYITGKLNYKDFVDGLDGNTEDKEFFQRLGVLVAHIDEQAANKNEWNTYPDKRTIAGTQIRQTAWVDNLIKYLFDGEKDVTQGVKNAMNYLKNPRGNVTIVSEEHKRMISENLLKKPYLSNERFIADLHEFFRPYNLSIIQEENLTRLYSAILYDNTIRIIWDPGFGKPKDTIQGLVVNDNTGWIQEAIDDLEDSSYIVLWWSKRPSGGEKTLKMLRQAIKSNKEFYLYYSINQKAVYKATIVDFAIESDYEDRNWNHNEDVAWYKPKFNEYSTKNKHGNIIYARIAFLAEKFEKIKIPIPFDKFYFFNGYSAPTQNNMQPYVGIKQFIKPKPRETKLDPETILQHIFKYIQGQGFYYEKQDIANFYLSLKTKPFAILAGISGTGKTKLVQLFAEAIGNGKEEQCSIIPVKPDWTDNSDLLGYTNLHKEFERKELTKIIEKAIQTPDLPYFIILDEMNLARVEHYFSDFLSIIETRKLKDDRITTKPLLSENEIGEKSLNRESLVNLQIPENLYIVGTVNMDETTFPFSKKVLDRANSIEINKVVLEFPEIVEVTEPLHEIYNDFLISNKINSSHLNENDRKILAKNKFIENLEEINKILAMSDLQIGYRIRDEIAFYMLNSLKTSNLLSWDDALDYQVMQKILPRIQGSALNIRNLLIHLINYFMGVEKFETRMHYDGIGPKLEEHINISSKYNRTLRKLDFMLRRYEQDGFTSFWI